MHDDPRALALHLREQASGQEAPDSARIAAWFQAEHPVVWRLCLGLLSDPNEADDAAQDAMLHLHDRLDGWDPARSYPSWRTTVVLNLCRDRLRRVEARRRAEGSAASAPFELSERLPSPDAAADQEELRGAITCALEGLTPREREAFVLRDLEGLSGRAAAEVLGVTESTVRSLLTLARRRLRILLGERMPDVALDLGSGGAS